jgi:hypothetical protein
MPNLVRRAVQRRPPAIAAVLLLLTTSFTTSPIGAQATGDAPTAAPPADGRPRFIDVRVGFDKKYKLGVWTPVRVAVWSGQPAGSAPVNGSLSLETADGDDVPCVYTSDPFQVRGGGVTDVTMYVRFGNSAPSMTLTLFLNGDEALRETIDAREGERENFELPLQGAERLVLAVGHSSTIDEVAGRSGVADLSVAHVSVLDLPTRSYGYDGADAVLLSADLLDRYATLTADGPQVAALGEWLQSGGKLTIVAGRDAPLLFALPAWRKLAPITVGDLVPLPPSAELEIYSGNKPIPAADPANRLTVLRSGDKADVTELAEGDLPLVVRRAVGLGVLTVSFVDLEHPRLRNWAGRAAMLAKAMRLGVIKGDGVQTTSSQSYRYGYGNLSGQLRSALDQYEGVAVISFFALALMILLYIALIGPFDYLLVKNVFRRTEMTWFTFPTIVIVTTVGAYYAARWMKGDELRVSQVDIIDCDVASGTVRGTTFAGIFSPKSDGYDLKVEPPQTLLAKEITPGRSITTWLGLSGGGYGGMQNQAGGASSWLASSYDVAPDLESLQNVPIQVWSSKLFYSRWEGRSELAKSGLRRGSAGTLAGSLKSPLKVPLKDALLCYGSKAYRFPLVEADTEYQMSDLAARDLSIELHNAEVVKAAKAHLTATVRTKQHDPGSQDVGAIVRKMMFYDAAGGRQHANLENDYQSYLDLSELLQLNRAVLVGHVDHADDDGAKLDLTTDGTPVTRKSDRRWVFVRIVLPVEPAASSP